MVESKDTGATKKEVEDGKGMAVLAYILAFIPYFAEKKNKFVRFHAVQGMNILLIAIIYGVASGIINGVMGTVALGSLMSGSLSGFGMFGFVNMLLGLVGLAICALDLVGLIYAAQGLRKEVPILGKIKIFKK